MSLSVIIPFLNEGYKLEWTVKGIRDTSPANTEIIIINDRSEDGYDYLSVAKRFNCVYHYNEVRLGVAESRNLGVKLAKYEYCILFDAHMTFTSNTWSQTIINHISKDHRAIYCTKILVLDNTGKEYPNTCHEAQAAYFYFEPGEHNYLNCKWATLLPPKAPVIQIPCILGATYAFHKPYFEKLLGLSGLIEYGSDEQLLSIKAWLEGGSCKLITDVKIGHWFREKHPYQVQWGNMLYNKLFIIQTCIEDTEPHFAKMLDTGKASFSCQALFNKNIAKMQYYREHFLYCLFERDFDFIRKINTQKIGEVFLT